MASTSPIPSYGTHLDGTLFTTGNFKSVAVSRTGKYLAMGAINTGVAVFEYDIVGDTWTVLNGASLVTSANVDPVDGSFGTAVAIEEKADGDFVLAVGAPESNGTNTGTGDGAVYIYDHLFAEKKVIGSPNGIESFGVSLKLGYGGDDEPSQVTLLVGAPSPAAPGAAYMFSASLIDLSDDWHEQYDFEKIFTDSVALRSPAVGDLVGFSVDMTPDGSKCVIGCPNLDTDGAIFIFSRGDNNLWSVSNFYAKADLNPDDVSTPQLIGHSVAMSSDSRVILAGAVGAGDGDGAVIHVTDDYVPKIITPTGAGAAAFGTAIGLSADGTRAVITSSTGRIEYISMEAGDIHRQHAEPIGNGNLGTTPGSARIGTGGSVQHIYIASSDAGESVALSYATGAPAPPAAPTDSTITVSNVTSTTAAISYEVAVGVTYAVYTSTTEEDVESYAAIVNAALTPATVTEGVVSGLSAGVANYINVLATDGVTGGKLAYTLVTVTTPAAAIVAPTSIVVTPSGITASATTLTWSATTGGSNHTYEVWRSPAGSTITSYADVATHTLAATVTDVTTVSFSDLKHGVTYVYTVFSFAGTSVTPGDLPIMYTPVSVSTTAGTIAASTLVAPGAVPYFTFTPVDEEANYAARYTHAFYYSLILGALGSTAESAIAAATLGGESSTATETSTGLTINPVVGQTSWAGSGTFLSVLGSSTPYYYTMIATNVASGEKHRYGTITYVPTKTTAAVPAARFKLYVPEQTPETSTTAVFTASLQTAVKSTVPVPYLHVATANLTTAPAASAAPGKVDINVTVFLAVPGLTKEQMEAMFADETKAFNDERITPAAGDAEIVTLEKTGNLTALAPPVSTGSLLWDALLCVYPTFTVTTPITTIDDLEAALEAAEAEAAEVAAADSFWTAWTITAVVLAGVIVLALVAWMVWAYYSGKKAART